MENKLSAPVPGIDMSFCGRYVRRHSSSTGATPPRSPTFLIHKPPSNPGDLSTANNTRYPLSPTLGRMFASLTPTKKVCTMDCSQCRSFMAKNLRSDSDSPNNLAGSECLSAPCSRKSSVVFHGKFIFKHL